jgi:hypothetical protein
LNSLHQAIAQALADDKDMHNNLPIVQARLARFHHGKALSCTNTQDLCALWLSAHTSANTAQQESLLKTLFSVAKVKPFWEEIDAGLQNDRAIPAENFRDQLALKVARHISDLSPMAHPLAGFFAWLEPRR